MVIQPSGTGKGAGFSIPIKLCNELGLKVVTLTQTSDAGAIGSYGQFDTEVNVQRMTEGTFMNADIITMEEASTLFDFVSEVSEMTLTYFQINMNSLWDESDRIGKNLAKGSIDFKSHFSSLLTTYKPKHIYSAFVSRGFLQRMVLIPRDIDFEWRRKVLDIAVNKMIRGNNGNDPDKLLDSIAHRVDILRDFYDYKYPYEIGISKEGAILAKELTEKFLYYMSESTPHAREKLEEFTHRLFELILRFAVHHAMLNLKEEVDRNDINYARQRLFLVWKKTVRFIEELLEYSTKDKIKRNALLSKIITTYKTLKLNKELKQKGYVVGEKIHRRTFVKYLQRTWQCSYETASSRLSNFEQDLGSAQNNWFMKENIKGVDYVRLLKDIK